MKYNYIRQDFLLRVSSELMELIHEMADSLRVSRTDVINFILSDTLDPTHRICPDYDVLPEVLNNRAYNRARHSMETAKQKQLKSRQSLEKLIDSCDSTFEDVCDNCF